MPKEKRPAAWNFMMNSGMAKWFGKANAALYDASGGKMFGKLGDARLLTLTTTGRKSGKKRTVPLVYGRDGDNFILIASKGGDPSHPAWYFNLTANPTVEIHVEGDRKTMVARTAEGDERERGWDTMVALYADYNSYRKWTDRVIPVVILEPAA